MGRDGIEANDNNAPCKPMCKRNFNHQIRSRGACALDGEHIRRVVAVVDTLGGLWVASTLDLPYITPVQLVSVLLHTHCFLQNEKQTRRGVFTSTIIDSILMSGLAKIVTPQLKIGNRRKKWENGTGVVCPDRRTLRFEELGRGHRACVRACTSAIARCLTIEYGNFLVQGFRTIIRYFTKFY